VLEGQHDARHQRVRPQPHQRDEQVRRVHVNGWRPVALTPSNLLLTRRTTITYCQIVRGASLLQDTSGADMLWLLRSWELLLRVMIRAADEQQLLFNQCAWCWHICRG
jgi:hypothetical protein